MIDRLTPDERDDGYSVSVNHADSALECDSTQCLIAYDVPTTYFTLLSSLNISRVILELPTSRSTSQNNETDGGHQFWRVIKLVVQGYQKAVT